jgi:cold shock CspA family protein
VEIEFGHVQQYDTERGFGFVSSTFRNVKPPYKNNVWFHIKNIKRDYPDLAKELDTGSSPDISFWYEIDGKDRKKVNKVWLDQKNIPKQQKDDLVIYIEQMWSDISSSLPEWLERMTIDLVGENHKNKLSDERSIQMYNQKKSEDNNHLQKKHHSVEKQSVKIKPIKNFGALRFDNPDRIKYVYLGLPEHLTHIVLWVDPKYRKNRLSFIPGGSDVVVEYHNGQALGYNRIKMPSRYIRTFFDGIVDDIGSGDKENGKAKRNNIDKQISNQQYQNHKNFCKKIR